MNVPTKAAIWRGSSSGSGATSVRCVNWVGATSRIISSSVSPSSSITTRCSAAATAPVTIVAVRSASSICHTSSLPSTSTASMDSSLNACSASATVLNRVTVTSTSKAAACSCRPLSSAAGSEPTRPMSTGSSSPWRSRTMGPARTTTATRMPMATR